MKTIAIVVAAVLAVAHTQAQVPGAINYQGRLTTAAGQPVPDGNVRLTVRLFGSLTGSDLVWRSALTQVPVRGGVFALQLGPGFSDEGQQNALNLGPAVFDGRFTFLEVQPEGQAALAPRTPILATPWAFVAGTVADGSITAAKLADGSVTSAKLANNTVTSAKILDGEVGTADLADSAVTSAKILDGGVGTADLANSAVTSAKILDGEVGTADLANSAVTSAKILDGGVGSIDVLDGSVVAVDLANNAVTSAKLLSDASSLSKVSGGAMTVTDAVNVNSVLRIPVGGATIEYPAGTLNFVNSGGNRVTFTSGGRVGVGTASPSTMLHVTGQVRTEHDTPLKPTGGPWSPYGSDRRLKKNIEEIPDALSTLLRFHGVTFEYKNPVRWGVKPGRHLGFIAQDVGAVFPDWLIARGDGYYTYSLPAGFDALMVEAIREQQRQIDDLRSRNEDLRETNERLRLQIAAQGRAFESRLRAIEARIR